jgi:hypothetical protein
VPGFCETGHTGHRIHLITPMLGCGRGLPPAKYLLLLPDLGDRWRYFVAGPVARSPPDRHPAELDVRRGLLGLGPPYRRDLETTSS